MPFDLQGIQLCHRPTVSRPEMIEPIATPDAVSFLQTPAVFRQRVERALTSENALDALHRIAFDDLKRLSVVLLIIGGGAPPSRQTSEPCLILNKRSRQVRQPGDICCPGGGVELGIDKKLSRLLRLPASPLRRWRHAASWRRENPRELQRLRLLAAAALREGWEEMRLIPFNVSFLGILPPEELVMFRRVILPLVVWMKRQRRFHPNWEVERVVRMPVREFLNPTRYICYRLSMPEAGGRKGGGRRDFPAFRFDTAEGTEILWGATYRMIMRFLNQVLGFAAPGPESLEVVAHELPPQYMTGSSLRN